MSFQSMGNGTGWVVDDDDRVIDNQDTIDRLNKQLKAIDIFSQVVLKKTQQAVAAYVNIRDDSGLACFQQALGEIFQQAFEAMQSDKKMTI